MHVSDDFSDLPVAVTEGPGAGAVCNLYLGVALAVGSVVVAFQECSREEAALANWLDVHIYVDKVAPTSILQLPHTLGIITPE